MTTHHINLYPPGNEVKAVVWPRSHSHRELRQQLKTKQPNQKFSRFASRGIWIRAGPSWFDGMTITLTEDGDTVLTGPVADQAALHGLLKKVRDLGLPLLSVNPIKQ